MLLAEEILILLDPCKSSCRSRLNLVRSDVSHGLAGIGQHCLNGGLELVDLSRSKALGELLVRGLRVGAGAPGGPNAVPGQADVNLAAIPCARRSLDEPLFFNAIEVSRDGSTVYAQKTGNLGRRRLFVVMDGAEHRIGTTRDADCLQAFLKIVLHRSSETRYPEACAVLDGLLVTQLPVTLVPSETA